MVSRLSFNTKIYLCAFIPWLAAATAVYPGLGGMGYNAG